MLRCITLFLLTWLGVATSASANESWYGGSGGRELLGPTTRAGGVQATPVPDAYGTFECNWTDPYVLTIPTNWVSGVYLVKLTGSSSGKQAYIQFVVREDSRDSVFLFQRSITTDQAYNTWPGAAYGGLSLYNGAVKVSFNRPYAVDESYSSAHNGAGFFPRWEINMVRWLEMNGYDVTYATNIDVHENPNLLLNRHAFLSVAHDEYWSWEMRQNVETSRDAGVGLGFFAGNESYWPLLREGHCLYMHGCAPQKEYVIFTAGPKCVFKFKNPPSSYPPILQSEGMPSRGAEDNSPPPVRYGAFDRVFRIR
jgi:hypothetical protein